MEKTASTARLRKKGRREDLHLLCGLQIKLKMVYLRYFWCPSKKGCGKSVRLRDKKYRCERCGEAFTKEEMLALNPNVEKRRKNG